MPNKPFDYTIINPLERPTSTDINQLQGQAHADVRALAQFLFASGYDAQDGFIGTSFGVRATSPASGSVIISPGIAFQTKTADANIGSIAGLNDDLPYKVLYTEERTIDVLGNAPAPTTSGYRRRDLLQIRALTPTERLGNQQNKGIFNVSNTSFQLAQVYKTLSSDLTSQAPQFVPSATPGTDAIVYKVGVEGPYATWDDAPLPATDPGYMAVAELRISASVTTITFFNIYSQRNQLKIPTYLGGTGTSLLGSSGTVPYSTSTALAYTDVGTTGQFLTSNGTSAPTWKTTLPVENGGTERNTLTANALLVGNGTSPVNFVSPVDGSLLIGNGAAWQAGLSAIGQEGKVIISNGSAWTVSTANTVVTRDQLLMVSIGSGTFQELTNLTILDWQKTHATAYIGLQPIPVINPAAPTGAGFFLTSSSGATGTVKFAFTELSTGDIYEYWFTYGAPMTNDGSMPRMHLPLPNSTYNIRVWAKMNGIGDINFRAVQLVVSQG